MNQELRVCLDEFLHKFILREKNKEKTQISFSRS